MKSWTMPLLLAVCSLISAQETNQTSYAQTTPVNQPKQNSNITGDYPLFVLGDLVYGRITTQQATSGAAIEQGIITNPLIPFRTKNGFGFRAGLGVGMQDKFNLHLLWTWMRNSTRTETTTVAATANASSLLDMRGPNLIVTTTPSRSVSIQNDPASITGRVKQRYQTLDLFVQAASAMFWDYFRMQPFGGLRYLYYKANFMNTLTSTLLATPQSNDMVTKLNATGLFIGTDLKFVFNHYFYFFSTLMTGIVAGHWRANSDSDITGNVVLVPTFPIKTEMTMSPFFEGSWGIGFEYLFSNNVMLAFRFAYRLTHLSHEASAALIQGSPMIPGFIRTQAGIFGFTLSF